MAFARVKTYWVKMKATDITAKSPPKGKDHHMPEQYVEDVLEGACLIEGQCRRSRNGGPQTCLPAAHGVAEQPGRGAHLHQQGIQDPREADDARPPQE